MRTKALGELGPVETSLRSARRDRYEEWCVVWPVTQSKFGSPAAPEEEQGDCFGACLASLIHVTLDKVPYMTVSTWQRVSHRFLAEHHFRMLDLPRDYAKHLGRETYYIVNGKSPRGDFLHAVIYRDGQLAHDPHPSGLGVENISDITVLVWMG